MIWQNKRARSDDEWIRRARISNRRYLQALARFEKHEVPGARPEFVPDALRLILAEVTALHGVTLRQLRGRSRVRHLVVARRVIAIRARQKGCSYPQIGRALNRDHTTIIHHVQGAVS